MNTNEMNMKELNLDELEAVNGGWSWKHFGMMGGVGAVLGAVSGAVLGICTGPVGWCALGTAVVLGGTLGISAGTIDD